MATGVIDLWGSRRTNFERCEWYARDEKATKDLSKIVFESKPRAIFYAKEANATSYAKQELGGVFLGNESVVTISTQDVLEGLRTGDRVKFRGVIWFITDVQQKEKHMQTQFLDNVTKTTYINLKR